MVMYKKTFLILGCLFFAWAAMPAGAQLENLLPGGSDEPAAVTEEKDDLGASLAKWKEESEQKLKGLETDVLPAGVSEADLKARKQNLEETLASISRHTTLLQSLKSTSEDVVAAREKKEQWTGFEDPPPYSILMVDDLMGRKAALAEKKQSNESSIEIFQAGLDRLLATKSALEDDVAKRTQNFSAASPENKNQATWQLAAAKERQRSFFIKTSALKTNISSLKNEQKVVDLETDLFDRQIKTAEKKIQFGDEEIDKIKEDSAARQAVYEKEGEGIRARLGDAASDRAKMEAGLQRLKANADAKPEEVSLAALKLKTLDMKMDSLQKMADTYDEFKQIDGLIINAYEYRRILLESRSPEKRSKACGDLEDLSASLTSWLTVTENEISSVAADLTGEEAQRAGLEEGDPMLELIDSTKAILLEKQQLLQRGDQTVTAQQKLIDRWVFDYKNGSNRSWSQSIAYFFSVAWEKTLDVWNIHLIDFKKTTEVDGQTITEDGSVRIGDLIRGLFVFLVAYLILSKVSRFFELLLIKRHYIRENQAKTLRNWLMLLVAFVLVIVILFWLKIPLTVFTFLAGALAIGVGFGTQTIINNFISGIILLFERKVRVGDVIEVDSVTGVVSEINTRSSIVRGFDGIESVIPNSLFLENRVVNWTLNSALIRRQIHVGAAYGTKPQAVIDILLEAADRHGVVLKTPPPTAVFANFGDSSLDFVLYFWIEFKPDMNAKGLDSDLRIMIDKSLSEAKISIPFPQRDINFGQNGPLQVEVSNKKEPDAPSDARN